MNNRLVRRESFVFESGQAKKEQKWEYKFNPYGQLTFKNYATGNPLNNTWKVEDWARYHCEEYQPLAAPEILSPGKIKIFPNPASDFVQIEISKLLPGAELRVFDTQGRPVFSQGETLSGGRFGLDVRGLQTGFYLIEILSKGGVVGRGKLAVLR